ncbi:MAG TPA: type III pantothenate kinase [Spirochaetales bacterium]|nr:type III pantothenate kinase [Spirochaetales bacterium]HRV28477.1 type III pantothenate kinase [Spirochaetia bacterium]
MLIAADIRNDGVTIGFHSGAGWLKILELGTNHSADEYAFFISGMLGTQAGKDSHAIVSSVVPALTEPITSAIESAFGIRAMLVGPGIKTGIKIRTEFPSEVGSDLVAMAAAAHALGKTPCVIIDCRALLTVSFVNRAGEFLGTSIYPGPEMSIQAMRHHAVQLPDVRLAVPKSAIGRNTVQAMQAGVYWGFSGAVSALCNAITNGFLHDENEREQVKIIASGNPKYRQFLPEHSEFCGSLALDGLATIAQLNI